MATHPAHRSGRLSALVPMALATCVGLAPFAARPARAGRAVEEPPAVKKLVHGAARADLDKALAATGLAERCPKDALKTNDLLGVECRAAVATALLRARPLASKADVDARASLFADLNKIAASVSSWEPLAPPPGLGRSRFDAHRTVSRALFGLYDELTAAKSREPTRALVEGWLSAGPEPRSDPMSDPKSQACLAAQRSVELAMGADATAEERGAAQSLLTSHACFLDESRLRAEPKPGAALQGSKDAALVAAETSGEATIRAYAASRSIDLERCTKHLDMTGKPKDAQKLEQCACSTIGRWKLPARDASTSTTLPVSPRVSVSVDVAPNGTLSRCGPVSVAP